MVDIASMDYIFENKKANTETVSEEAYKACIQDARQESEKEEAIVTLAKQNAQNIIKALIQPFIENMEEEASGDSALLAAAQQRAQNLSEEYVKNAGSVTGTEYTITWKYI